MIPHPQMVEARQWPRPPTVVDCEVFEKIYLFNFLILIFANFLC